MPEGCRWGRGLRGGLPGGLRGGAALGGPRLYLPRRGAAAIAGRRRFRPARRPQRPGCWGGVAWQSLA
jgi:hypothetical protein